MEFTSTSIKVILDPQRAQSGFFEFKFPNIWMLHIGHKLREFLVLIPVDEQTTRILLRKYGKWTPFHRINVTIAWLMRPFSNFILRQDKRIVLSQQPMDSTAAKSEILMPSDRAVAAFRDLLSR